MLDLPWLCNHHTILLIYRMDLNFCGTKLLRFLRFNSHLQKFSPAKFRPALRRRSHYGENDGNCENDSDGDITFRCWAAIDVHFDAQ